MVVTTVVSLCKTSLLFPLSSGRGSTFISEVSSLLLLVDILLSGSTVYKVFCFFFGCCSRVPG
ncbi:4975_t:CDS:1, partial [Funneliformis mosseae]